MSNPVAPGGRAARGIVAAVLAFAVLSANDALTKWLSATYPIVEITAFISIFALLPVGVIVWRTGGLASLRPRHPGLVAARAMLTACNVLLIYFAFTRLPLADAYSIAFASPMIVTALSAPLLGEKVGWRRWSAIMVGFFAVLFVLRPGFHSIGIGQFAALGSALLYGVSLIILRRIAGAESDGTLLGSYLLAIMILSLPSVPFVYKPPGASDLLLMIAAGIITGIGNLGVIYAFRLASASVVAPFMYSQMIWGVTYGLVLFGDVPDARTIGGSAVIVACGLYLLWRETAGQRRAALAEPA